MYHGKNAGTTLALATLLTLSEPYIAQSHSPGILPKNTSSSMMDQHGPLHLRDFDVKYDLFAKGALIFEKALETPATWSSYTIKSSELNDPHYDFYRRLQSEELGYHQNEDELVRIIKGYVDMDLGIGDIGKVKIALSTILDGNGRTAMTTVQKNDGRQKVTIFDYVNGTAHVFTPPTQGEIVGITDSTTDLLTAYFRMAHELRTGQIKEDERTYPVLFDGKKYELPVSIKEDDGVYEINVMLETENPETGEIKSIVGPLSEITLKLQKGYMLPSEVIAYTVWPTIKGIARIAPKEEPKK